MATLICDLGGVLFTESGPQRRGDSWRVGNDGAPGAGAGAKVRADLLPVQLAPLGSEDQVLPGWGTAPPGAVNLDVLEVLSRLRDRGWQLVGATDAVPWDEVARPEQFDWVRTLFERVVTAAEVGACRPDPRFFAGLRSACRPGSRLYVDDDLNNAAAARRAGFDAHVFTGAAALEAACRHLVVAVN